MYAWITPIPWRLFSTMLLMAPTAFRARRYWGWTLVAKNRTAPTTNGNGANNSRARRQSSQRRKPYTPRKVIAMRTTLVVASAKIASDPQAT